MKDRRYYCEVLRVEDQASQIEIKRAYHRLARKHHPDLNSNDPFANDRVQLIQEAYEFLQSNPYVEKSLVPQATALPSPRQTHEAQLTPLQQNQTVATFFLAFAILVATAATLYLRGPTPKATGEAPSVTVTNLDSLPRPSLQQSERHPASDGQALLVKFSRRGALGNVVRVDEATKKCPKNSYPATYEKKVHYLSQICVRKFLDTDTVVEDVKLMGPGQRCDTGYSMQGSVYPANEPAQAICVKVSFPKDAGRAVVRLYESDERAGCEASHEVVGVEAGTERSGRRRIICQQIAAN